MAKVLKFGLMVVIILGTLVKGSNKAKVYIIGLMVLAILETGLLMKCLVMVPLNGLMAVISKENLKMELCMVMEFTLGRTDVDMKVTTVSTKNMERVPTHTQMVVSTAANGLMVFSTALVALLMRIVHLNEKAYGQMAN